MPAMRHLLGALTLVAAVTDAAPQAHGIPKLGAVASESSVCSKIGTKLLKKGGTAADAIVGTVFCIGTIGMYHSGIGGGGFMIVRGSDGKYEFIDFRETAPAAAFEDMYKDDENLSIYGGLASGVPGELRGLEHLHNKYGKLPWKEVMMPAVKVAREGFVVTQDLVSKFESVVATDGNFFVTDPNWAIDFAPNGTRVGLGDIMTRKRYADTLETIANHGPDAFYTGAIANATITALRAKNGTMTLDDLKNYTVAIREPATLQYHDYKLTATNGPSGGAVALAALNIFSGYDQKKDGINLTTHHLDESLRWAYGERTQLGDPSFQSNITAYLKKMVDPATGAAIRKKISDTRTYNVSHYDPLGLEELATPGTSEIAAADHSGMAISLTTTVNLLFGSELMVPETGVIMNNEMNDFSIPGSSNAFGFVPSPSNYVKPGKRPQSSIACTIAEDCNGRLYYVTGAAGGSRIISATVQSLWHVIDQGMNSEQALAAARLHDQLQPNTAVFEWGNDKIKGYDNKTTAYMASLGHNVTFIAPGQSAAQAIRWLANGTFEAATEPRLYAGGGYAV